MKVFGWGYLEQSFCVFIHTLIKGPHDEFLLGFSSRKVSLNISLLFSRGYFISVKSRAKFYEPVSLCLFPGKGFTAFIRFVRGSIAWEKEIAAGLEAKIVLVLVWPNVPVCWGLREEAGSGWGFLGYGLPALTQRQSQANQDKPVVLPPAVTYSVVVTEMEFIASVKLS